MKCFNATLLFCLLISVVSSAAPRYWVGSQNGEWSDAANWSSTSNGTGGAGVPGPQDSVVFLNPNILPVVIHADQSAIVSSIRVNGNTTLFASTSVTIRVTKTFYITNLKTLKDSTSEDVSFNIIMNGSTNTVGAVPGDWVFEGGVPLANPATSGAMFTAESGSTLTVLSILDLDNPNPGSQSNYSSITAGRLVFKKNTGHIVSLENSLTFLYAATLLLQDNDDILIPNAGWSGDKYRAPTYGGIPSAPAATIDIEGSVQKIKFAQAILNCGRLVINLANQQSDVDLAIPDGSTIRGNLEVYNTNNHILTLLSSTGNGNSVTVTLGTSQQNSNVDGNLVISGANTKVTLAKATPATASNDYKLFSWKSFRQSGGNFSLQDYDGATGTSMLELRNYFEQTGGTFYTNTTSTQGKFIVAMNPPPYITGPSGSFYSGRTITASSGTIDNATHNVTLQIYHALYVVGSYEDLINGVVLLTPLSVGKLILLKTPLTTTATNILTVNNPSPDAITVSDQLSSCCVPLQSGSINYVNGPLRRATNASVPYLFPVGKGNNFPHTLALNLNKLLHFDSLYITPSSDQPSMYQAEYFQSAYPDLSTTAPLAGVSNAEYWNTFKVSGADASVQLFPSGEAIPNAPATSALVTAGYVNGHWIAENGTLLTPGTSTTGSVTSKPLSALGLFTIGYGDAALLSPPSGTVFDGLNYKYYEGGYALMPNFNTLTPLKAGSAPNIDLGIRRSGVSDSFAVMWEGYINIPTAGAYTFETVSDDGSRFYFNTLYNPSATPLIDNDSTHPPKTVTGTVNITAPGRYPVTITYFENYGGETMQLFWAGPGISRQQIPDAAFTAGTTQPPAMGGLNYKYYEGSFDVLPNFGSLTPVKSGNSPNVDISVRPAGVNDNFAFTWDGTITIPSNGTYTFETISDDGSRLSFNGNIIVNNDGLHAPASATGSVTINAGTYPISISYFEKDGGEAMQVYWSGPGIPRQAIPNIAFGSTTVIPPVTGNGLSYKYYEGDYNTLPDFSGLIPVKTGNSSNADISVRPAGVNDHFAFVWEGTINLPAAGTYTFETISDDGSKIYFNSAYSVAGNSLVNNDGLHPPVSATGAVTVPVAGAYPITVTYFEKDGGEAMQLYWTGPGISRQLIPDAAFGAAATLPAIDNRGLNYKYFEADFNALPDYTSLVPVKTGTSANVDISLRTPGVNDHFAFIWDGYINMPSPGTYTFETISDDGSKVYVNMPYSLNGSSTVNNDGLHAPTSVTGTVTVAAAGRYPISITFFEKDGGETMQLYWSGPGISHQPVPDAAFTTTSSATGTSTMSASEESILNNLIGLHATKFYPNPFIENVTVDYYNAGAHQNKVSIGVYDLTGKMVYSYQPSNLMTGNNRWLLNLKSKKLLPGVYMAQVKINGLPVKSIKLVKTK